MKEEKRLLVRITKYCAGAERCTKDVLDKLAAWQIDAAEWDGIIEVLRKEGFLDDGRYAVSFVREKWNLNHWGKIKIRHHLESKELPPNLIENALESIDATEYIRVLHAVLASKWKSLAPDTSLSAAQKIAAFAAQRGFEQEAVEEWLGQYHFRLP
jgi:regulatory protein